MRFIAPPFLLYSLLYVAIPTLAIFADEAYKIDFQHALLGTPKSQNTFFHAPSAASKASLLYTLSEKAILGAINPKDGAIVWRQDLADAGNRSTKSFLKAGDKANVIISGIGDKVRAWDAADGRLVWSWQATGEIHGLEILDLPGASKAVAVLSGEVDSLTITSLDNALGTVEWLGTHKR